MKNKLFKKLFALTLTLLVALAFSACTPVIHIHTGESSSEATSTNETVVKEETTPEEVTSEEEVKEEEKKEESKVTTSVASSEPKKTESSKKEESTSSKSTSSKKTSSKETSSKKTSSKSSSSDNITRSKAQDIALKDAGLKASQVYDLEIELDSDRGVLRYEVSFEYQGKDYDYEINAQTGKIISVEKPNATSSEAKISKSKAKSIALNHAGVKESEISRYEIELEKDDGIWKYEISFNVGYVEYDFTINAETGKILDFEKDIDD